MIYFMLLLTVVNMKFILEMLYLYIISRVFNIRDSKVELDVFKTVPHNIYIVTEDGVSIGAYLLRPDAIDQTTKFVVYLHGVGSSRNCTTRYATYETLVRMGYCILVLDYRGFADSEGAFTLRGSILDTKAGFKYLIDRFGARDIVLVGHSLGTGVAAEYFRYVIENDLVGYRPRKLVLLAPFTTFPDACSEHPYWAIGSLFLGFAVRRLKRDFEFNTLINLGYIDHEDVIIYHGINDPVVPVLHTIKIRETYSNVFVELTKHDHVNIIHDTSTWHKLHSMLSSKRDEDAADMAA
jgi:acetyl esterase/lipase